jgi:hypothetical protein
MKKLFTAAPLALAIAATPALAQSTEDTLERMQQQLNAMQQQLNSAKDTGIRFNGFSAPVSPGPATMPVTPESPTNPKWRI